MTRRVKWAALGTLVIIAYMLAALWWWNELPRPYELPPPLTPHESRVIEKARGKHGREIRVRVETGRIYFVRDGREILIARRG